MQLVQIHQGNLVDYIIKYEGGESNNLEDLSLFAHLIKTGQAWTLQGHYGRTAMAYIEEGLIARDGTVDESTIERFAEEDAE